MNNRIKELVALAEAYANEQNELFGADFKTEYDQKFAELIVRECLEVVRQSDDECYDEWDYADRDLCGIIKEHFGVE